MRLFAAAHRFGLMVCRDPVAGICCEDGSVAGF